MPSVHVDLTKALSIMNKNAQELLEPLLRKVLTRACVRIRNEARENHPKWDSRTGALEKAITYRFIKKWTEAEVYISEKTLYDTLDENANILDSTTKYKEGQYVGRKSIFLNKYTNYANYLINGTHAHSSVHAKALRFVGKDGRIHFVKKPKRVKGIRGDDWLARARDMVKIDMIIEEVLRENGFK